MRAGQVRGAKRRFDSHFTVGAHPDVGLPPSHPAVREGRTLFPSTVIYADEAPRLLVSGANQRKLGDRVTKGRWRGAPIFALTLEERATCPASCSNWRQCYGNGMPRARRHRPGPELEYLLHAELAQKQEAHPDGFVVRLHILGDFYDLAYIALWHRWFAEFPALRVFGYTAHPRSGLMGGAVEKMNLLFPGRCAMRFSSAMPDRTQGGWAITIQDRASAPDAIICPAQTDKTDCCGTCGLCWHTDKTIAFLLHGSRFKQEPKPQRLSA